MTWLITGVLAAFVGWLAKVDDGTDLGGFGEALGGMLDGWAVIVAMCVPLTAAVILRLVGRLTTGGLSRELRRDAGEIANDAIGVIHNTLSFAASCLGVLAVLDVQNRRWGFAVTALCAETYAITCCALVSLVVTIWDDVVTATSLALRRWARRAR